MYIHQITSVPTSPLYLSSLTINTVPFLTHHHHCTLPLSPSSLHPPSSQLYASTYPHSSSFITVYPPPTHHHTYHHYCYPPLYLHYYPSITQSPPCSTSQFTLSPLTITPTLHQSPQYPSIHPTIQLYPQSTTPTSTFTYSAQHKLYSNKLQHAKRMKQSTPPPKVIEGVWDIYEAFLSKRTLKCCPVKLY